MVKEEAVDMILLEVKRLQELVYEHGELDPKYADIDIRLNNSGQVKTACQKIRADLMYLSKLM